MDRSLHTYVNFPIEEDSVELFNGAVDSIFLPRPMPSFRASMRKDRFISGYDGYAKVTETSDWDGRSSNSLSWDPSADVNQQKHEEMDQKDGRQHLDLGELIFLPPVHNAHRISFGDYIDTDFQKD